MICKNIECNNKTERNKLYCCLSCRNYYVNKYIRNYNKCSNTFNKKKEEKKKTYLENPKYCKECKDIIPYEKRLTNIFCNSSCCASYTNRGREITWQDKIRKGIKNYMKSEEYINKQNQNLKSCLNCSSPFKKNKLFCSFSCKKEYERKNMDPFRKYRLDCNFNFNLANYPEEFDFTLIETYGWYSPSNKKNNLGGVSRDHIFSVREGFELNIDPKLISHPANCQLLIHSKNISKHKKSSITLEELLDRIKIFNQKYGV